MDATSCPSLSVASSLVAGAPVLVGSLPLASFPALTGRKRRTRSGSYLALSDPLGEIQGKEDP